ncbi:hypothetical protein KIN20_002812, partial [Parelaphostrongylus tenuis]
MLCNTLRNHFGNMRANSLMRFPVHNLIPEKLQRYVVRNNTTLFCRLRSVEVNDHQMTALAQLEWTEITETPAISLLEDPVNTTLLEVKLNDNDLVTIWLEDGIINELLEQFDWNFEWMDEQLPVTSTVIPSDSRQFLTTLCTECYFQAELRPAFDGGILRTLVQLLDTSIEMEAGAFPKNMGNFHARFNKRHDYGHVMARDKERNRGVELRTAVSDQVEDDRADNCHACRRPYKRINDANIMVFKPFKKNEYGNLKLKGYKATAVVVFPSMMASPYVASGSLTQEDLHRMLSPRLAKLSAERDRDQHSLRNRYVADTHNSLEDVESFDTKSGALPEPFR